MSRKTIFAAAAVALLVIVLVPVRPADRAGSSPPATDDASTQRQLPDWAIEALTPPENAAVTESLRAEFPSIPGASAAGAELRREAHASILDDYQKTISVTPNERQRAALEKRFRYRSDPAWPRIPALPGVSGFEIQQCGDIQNCLSDRLAAERDDAEWARPMESRIYNALSTHARSGMGQVHVVCRQSIYGVLLPSYSEDNRQNALQLGSDIAGELGFVHHSFADRPEFQALYFTRSEEHASTTWIQ